VTAYILRRLVIGVGMLMAMSLVTFVLFFAGGDPSRSLCNKDCTPERITSISKTMGFDKPVMTQYGEFLKGLFVDREYPNDPEYRAKVAKTHPEVIVTCHAPCLGYSVSQQRSVNSILAEAAPITISISVVAFLLWIFFGVLLGVIAAVFKGRALDRGLVGATLVIYAMPTFFIGNLLLQYVSLRWGIIRYPSYVSIADGGPWNWFMGLILPASTLAVFFMAAYVRITRAFVLESLSEDYIRTARAKGLPGRIVLFKHALRAALTPLVSMAGLDFASLLAGSVITEYVFNFHGLGALAVQANHDLDLPVLIGLVLVAGTAVILMNIIVDVLYAFIDPRVRLD